jgi:transcriptional regulator with XRE-family HTH domain
MTLRELREKQKISRQEVADLLCVSLKAISNYELGYRQINLEQVLILKDLYKVSAEDIIKAQLNSHQCDL